MRKAYRIVGSSFQRPANLPEGFEIRERLVGEEIQLQSGLSFREVKDGSVVLYQKGVDRSNARISSEDVQELFRFLGDVAAYHMYQKAMTKCPGTPHRGHASSDWSCPLDRA